jgi:hypothetical protein
MKVVGFSIRAAIFWLSLRKRWDKSIEEGYDADGAVSYSLSDERKDFHAGGS